MSDKSSGIDFDRQAFVQPQAPPPRPAPRMGGLIFALVAIAAIAFLGYIVVSQVAKDPRSADDPVSRKTSHDSATDCIHVPVSEMSWPKKKSR